MSYESFWSITIKGFTWNFLAYWMSIGHLWSNWLTWLDFIVTNLVQRTFESVRKNVWMMASNCIVKRNGFLNLTCACHDIEMGQFSLGLRMVNSNRENSQRNQEKSSYRPTDVGPFISHVQVSNLNTRNQPVKSFQSRRVRERTMRATLTICSFKCFQRVITAEPENKILKQTISQNYSVFGFNHHAALLRITRVDDRQMTALSWRQVLLWNKMPMATPTIFV